MSCPTTDKIDSTVISAMFAGAAAKLKAGRDELSALDAATGDGDHGTAMGKVAEVIVSTIAAARGDDLPVLLDALGWAVMGTDSGSTGPLFGSFFLGMCEGIRLNQLAPVEFAKALDNGVTKMQSLTKARVGDKTLLDALIPAVEAIHAAARAGENAASMLRAGAIAASKGAEATKEMQAKFGRAKNIGERSIGHADPGATSIAFMFAGFEKGLADA